MIQSSDSSNLTVDYVNERVFQMVMQFYKEQRHNEVLQSIEEIQSKLPLIRIQKQKYSFLFDVIKQNIEDQMAAKTKLAKLQNQEILHIKKIEINTFKEVNFDNEENIFRQKLASGLPIFKSIVYLRYQSSSQSQQVHGEDLPFLPDQNFIDFNKINHEINTIKLFMEDQLLPSINLEFLDQNTLQLKDKCFPSAHQLGERAKVMAKIYLLKIYSDQHKKLKQTLKNDENYIENERQMKKLKAEMGQKFNKAGQNLQEHKIIFQVDKILDLLEHRANVHAFEQFKKKSGERAIQIKKSLQKLKSTINLQPNPTNKLKMLVSYRQKMTW